MIVRRPQAIMDIECYSNYFLIMFMRLVDNQTIKFELTEEIDLDCKAIRDIIKKYEIITFNGNKYDFPMLRLALKGANNALLKSANDKIINDMKSWEFEKFYELPEIPRNHIDLFELCPRSNDSGIYDRIGLKTFAGRLRAKKMQDLPYESDRKLSPGEILEIPPYCNNDLDNTHLLYKDLYEQVELRRQLSNQYHMDLRSKSDAQIAEEVIKSEMSKILKKKIYKTEVASGKFIYDVPAFIKFQDPQLNLALGIVTSKPFTVAHTGRITMPEELMNLQIEMGVSKYTMGMGGLHSTESGISHVSDNKILIRDWDVDSYYPKIMLICRLFPEQFGDVFLEVFNTIVETRLEAKAKAKDKSLPEEERAKFKIIADTLKIVINGTFGKLGSPYSVMYAPKLMIQVTVTGQLALLMLIEWLEEVGIRVVSANTDGIVMRCPVEKEAMMEETIHRWESVTGFTMEQSKYSGLYSRDVNNYIAIQTDGKVKTKGVFVSAGIKKNPQNEICNDALIEFLRDGTPFEETIRACEDINRFCTVRKVQGGAVKGKDYLGKVVRWYYARNERGTINYKGSNNKVPRTYGARPIMDLPAFFPPDVDYSWYVRECDDLLCGIGMKFKGQMGFDFSK
jgi:hypothetical protein